MTFNEYVRTVDEYSLGRERDFIRDCRANPKMPTIKSRADFDAYFEHLSASTALQECMEVSDARRLKTLESENAKLKKMLAEQMVDVATLKEMLGKNF